MAIYIRWHGSYPKRHSWRFMINPNDKGENILLELEPGSLFLSANCPKMAEFEPLMSEELPGLQSDYERKFIGLWWECKALNRLFSSQLFIMRWFSSEIVLQISAAIHPPIQLFSGLLQTKRDSIFYFLYSQMQFTKACWKLEHRVQERKRLSFTWVERAWRIAQISLQCWICLGMVFWGKSEEWGEKIHWAQWKWDIPYSNWLKMQKEHLSDVRLSLMKGNAWFCLPKGQRKRGCRTLEFGFVGIEGLLLNF